MVLSASIRRSVAALWVLLATARLGVATADAEATVSTAASTTVTETPAAAAVHSATVPWNRKLQTEATWQSYELEPFGLSFRSLAVESPSGKGAIETWLAVQVGEPLKLLVQEFLLETVRMETAASDNVPELLKQQPRLTLQVDMTLTAATEIVVGGNRQLLRRTRSLQESTVYTAVFTGSLSYATDPTMTVVPSLETVQEYWQLWMTVAWVQDYALFRQALRDSSNAVLQEAVSLQVETQLDEFHPWWLHPNDGSSSRSTGLVWLWTACILVAAATVAAALLLRRGPSSLKIWVPQQPQAGAFPQVLPGRSTEGPVPNATASSDRYLAQHRPDLFQVMQSQTTQAQSSATQQDESGATQEQQEAQQQASLASQDALQNVSMDHTGFTPVHTWWNRLVTKQQPLECDKDPAAYNFAYSDFPRHDGTPCLMYKEEPDGVVSIQKSTAAASDRRSSLTDEEFRQQLAAHAAAPFSSPQSSYYRNDETQWSSSLDDSYMDNTYDDTDGLDGSWHEPNVDFIHKLERLVAMRHRHYEKEMIMERGRSMRANRERELRQRDLALRRHEMELDLAEIEASLTPRSAMRKSVKPAAGATLTNGKPPTPATSSATRKTHRVVSSDSDFFGRDIYDTQRNEDDTVLQQANRLLHATGSFPPPPPPPPRDALGMQQQEEEEKKVSDPSPRLPPTSDATRSDANNNKRGHRHRRSHRRSFSHGTNEGLDSSQRSASTSKDDDIMMFGIAAYTHFT